LCVQNGIHDVMVMILPGHSLYLNDSFRTIQLLEWFIQLGLAKRLNPKNVQHPMVWRNIIHHF
jgi:hypothetical protein